MNSRVFLARDDQLGAEIVIKELEKAALVDPAKYFHEAQAMHATTHANVAPIHYACETNDHVCLAMPFFGRGSLSDRIALAPLPIREVVRVGLGALRGLGNIHAAGFVHFDMKPSNILFDDLDHPMVADFGQTRRMNLAGVADAPPMYTFAFTPEAFTDGLGMPLSDIYQLGLVLYRAANGEGVFARQRPLTPADLQDAVLNGHFPDRSFFLPHVPARLRRVIRKALAVDPTDRYQSASEFADDLGQVYVALDWSLVVTTTDTMEWRASTGSGGTLLVELSPEASKRWAVKVHQISGNGTKRRKGVADYWVSGLPLKAANAHLVSLFKTLGS